MWELHQRRLPILEGTFSWPDRNESKWESASCLWVLQSNRDYIGAPGQSHRRDRLSARSIQSHSLTLADLSRRVARRTLSPRRMGGVTPTMSATMNCARWPERDARRAAWPVESGLGHVRGRGTPTTVTLLHPALRSRWHPLIPLIQLLSNQQSPLGIGRLLLLSGDDWVGGWNKPFNHHGLTYCEIPEDIEVRIWKEGRGTIDHN